MTDITCPYCGYKIATIHGKCEIEGSCRCPECNNSFGFEMIDTDKMEYYT